MSDATVARRWALAAGLGAAAALSVADGTLSYQLLESWVGNALTLMLLALAAGVVISCGRIDISSGAAMSTVGMIIIWGGGVADSPAIGSLVGHAAAGAYLAGLYLMYHLATKAGVPSIIATLSGLLISKGLSTVLQSCLLGVGEVCRGAGGGPVTVMTSPPALAAALDSLAFSIPAILLVVGGLAYWRYRSRSGLQHIAVGVDEAAARFARIDVDRVRGLAFGLAAVLVFLATMLRLHGQNNGGWAPNTGWGEELIAIAVAVVGGARVSGGRFDPVAIGLATLVVYIFRDIIVNDLGVPTEATSILFGLLLIAVSWSDIRSERDRA